MKRLFIPYELAVIAKEKGFDELCFALIDEKNHVHMQNATDEFELKHDMQVSKYNNVPCVPAPLYQQIVDWFREQHEIVIYITDDYDSLLGYNRGWNPFVNGEHFYSDNDCFNNYYEALNKVIEEAFKLI